MLMTLLRIGLVSLLLVTGHARAQTADLQIDKVADKTTVPVGQLLKWTLTVTNSGPDPDSDVLIVDNLPPEVTAIQLDLRCLASLPDPQQIECHLSLLPGQTENLDIDVFVDSMPPADKLAYLTGVSTPSGLVSIFAFATNNLDLAVLSESNFLVSPRGIFLQADGLLLIADRGDPNLIGDGPIVDGSIIQVDPSNTGQNTVSQAGLLTNPNDVLLAPDGMIYVADLNGIRLDSFGQPLPNTLGRIIRVNPGTGSQTLIAEGGLVNSPSGLIWLNGSLAVADSAGFIYLIDPLTGAQVLVSQNGALLSPQALVAEGGRLVVADAQSGLVSVDTGTGSQSILTASTTEGGVLVQSIDIDLHSDGFLYVLDVGAGLIWRIDPVSGSTLQSYQPQQLSGLAGLDMADGQSRLFNQATISSASGDTTDSDTTNNSATALSVALPPVPAVITAAEAVGVSDTVVLSLSAQIVTAETVSVSETVALSLSAQIVAAELVMVSDQTALTLAIMLGVSESVTASDATTAAAAIQIQSTEAVNISDTISTQLAKLIQVSELVSVLESAAFPTVAIISISETVQAVDGTQINTLTTAIIAVLENIVTSDSAAIVPSVLLFVTEQVGADDNPGLSILLVPRITVARPIAGLCQDQISNGDALAPAVTELQMTFSLPMQDPVGDSEMIDASNPMNYRLVSSTDAATVLPNNCSTPLPANATEQTVVVRAYVAGSQTVVLGTALDTGLEKLHYRLLACSAGLHALGGTALDGNGDGNSGDDFAINFSVTARNLLANPNISDALTLWNQTGPASPIGQDVDNAEFAGAVQLDPATPSAQISQCIGLNGADAMRLGVTALAQQSNTEYGLRFEFYDAAGCNGVNLATVVGLRQANGNDWSNAWLDANVPATAVSARVSLEGNSATGPIFLDRSYLTTAPNIFRDGFEETSNAGAATGAATVCGPET